MTGILRRRSLDGIACPATLILTLTKRAIAGCLVIHASGLTQAKQASQPQAHRVLVVASVQIISGQIINVNQPVSTTQPNITTVIDTKRKLVIFY